MRNRTAVTIGDFYFNEFGVCKNPDRVIEVKASRNIYGYIEVAKVSEIPEKWAYGYRYELGDRGATTGVALKWGKFKSREEAINEGCVFLHTAFTRERDLPKAIAEKAKKMADMICMRNLSINAANSDLKNSPQLAMEFPE